ncbi:hypothetical protein CF326_g2155 [Tilletia indica]|nr:hypothetical protein CF326_g2155 [Tilletia indica]
MRLASGLWTALLAVTFTTAEARAKKDTFVIVSFRNDAGPVTSQGPSYNNETLHNAFEAYLKSRNIQFKPRFRFKDVRMPLGTSLALPNAADVDKLSAFAAVEQVETIDSGPGNVFERRIHKNSVSTSDHNHLLARASQQDTFGPHVMVGADKLHNEGYFGAGVKVAVIDTGLDDTHPAFGNCYGKPGCTVVGGYSFVSDDNEIVLGGSFRPRCDSYGVKSPWGHGTATGGVVGAQDNVRNVTGMAPQALLSPYRIAGCTGVSAPDIAAAAIVKAFQDGMDIISMSFSFDSGWQHAFISRLVSSVVALGTPVIISAGNGGRAGMFTPSSPTVAKGAYSVGSVQNNQFPGYTFAIKSSPKSSSGAVKSIASSYLTTNPFTFNKSASASLPVYLASKKANNPTDSCDDYPNSTPDLSKYVTVIGKASCSLTVQIFNARAKGAKYIIFYNDNTTEAVYADEFLDFNSGMQAGTISNADGVKIVNLVNAGNKVSLDFSSPKPVDIENSVTGGLLGDYSEYGPSWTVDGAPGAAAVGGSVLCPWPVNAGSYQVLTGTSFSTPQIAGAMALYQSIKGKSETPEQLNAIFTTTAKPIPYSKNSTLLNTVAQAGGGLIDVYRAVKSTSRVWPSMLLLNDTHNFNGSQKLTISNVGTQSQTFTLGHLPAGTAYAWDGSGHANYNAGPIKVVAKDQAGLKFSPASITIAPGRSQDVQVTFTAPNADPKNMAVYSGYVQLKSNEEVGSLTVPYMGLAMDLSATTAIDMTVVDGMPVTYLRAPSGDPVSSDNNTYDPSTFDGQLQLVWGTTVGIPLATISLIKGNTNFVPTYQQGVKGSKPCTSTSKPLPTSDLVATVSKQILLDRSGGDPNYDFISSNYTDAKGVARQVGDGYYRVLLQVLRPNSNPAKVCSYDSFMSRAFNIKKKKTSS